MRRYIGIVLLNRVIIKYYLMRFNFKLIIILAKFDQYK
ncbi:hypothetical protein H376_5450 [Rickettsia prowazekii str. GvF12]|nr:hypothetical protein H374_150 [Rickettsia prowazekii str. NMRC Madrid E]EOB09600.1 DNA-directed RNA polymerase subunit beta' [Rickettsia prowazekii str. Cairo 3]EOB10033.1 hypothetical protein H376_5450 [Rickettsia prowazekii str. GvF12]